LKAIALFAGAALGTSIEIVELQLEGKKRTSAADFIRGYARCPAKSSALRQHDFFSGNRPSYLIQ